MLPFFFASDHEDLRHCHYFLGSYFPLLFYEEVGLCVLMQFHRAFNHLPIYSIVACMSVCLHVCVCWGAHVCLCSSMSVYMWVWVYVYVWFQIPLVKPGASTGKLPEMNSLQVLAFTPSLVAWRSPVCPTASRIVANSPLVQQIQGL